MGKSKVKVKTTTGSSKGSKLGEQTAVAQNSPNEEKIVKAEIINVCLNCKTEHNGDLICPTCGQKLS